jgi:cytochrome c oxidase subunit 3
MPGTSITEDVEITSLGGPGGTSAGPPEGRGGGGGGGRGGGDGESRPSPSPLPHEASRRIYFTGIWLTLAAILMFFMALVSAYIVRKGTGGDWRPVELPRVLWLNTAILLLSSWTIEASRRAWERGEAALFRRWWAAGTALGFFFLAGQWVAWRELADAGVFVSTNPSSSFFYLLTAAHGAHIVGGLIALLYVLTREWTGLLASGGVAAEVAGIYWHFMDGLWVFLLLVLTLGR